MYKIPFLVLPIFISSFVCAANYKGKDTTNIYQKIDTTFIETYRDWLNAKLIAVVRSNKFSIKDNISQSTLEYGINTNVNMGLGVSFKGVGVEFQYNPPGLNNDDNKYGKSKQIAFAASANSRRFIYDFFYRYNQGYHTTTAYKIPNDTTGTLEHIYRPDIENTIIGLNIVYIFNNKRFSSSAPYNLTQRQKKSAGSFLLGTFGSLYTINADSVIFPDSLRKNFKEEVQFKDAGSITYGFSCGYTYTFVFFRHWFINLYTLPGLSIQQYYSTNAYNEQSSSNVAIGLALQSRFSIGFNRRNYFIGISYIGNNFIVDNDKKSSLNFKFGTFKFYYGHRFDLRKSLKKRL
ncbi:MAG: DUF4421 domain-containing protein [Bacteroidota bacterium]